MDLTLAPTSQASQAATITAPSSPGADLQPAASPPPYKYTPNGQGQLLTWSPLPDWVQAAPRRVGLISCGARKVAHRTQAKDLYVGGLFIHARRFVEAHCDEWGILSAKWWALKPDELVEPYDLTLTDMDANWQRHWALVTRTTISNKWLADPDDPQGHRPTRETVFVVVASRNYRAPFILDDQTSGTRAMRWWSPWTQVTGGIGKQLQWLSRNT